MLTLNAAQCQALMIALERTRGQKFFFKLDPGMKPVRVRGRCTLSHAIALRVWDPYMR
jgi:hypothetical protein